MPRSGFRGGVTRAAEAAGILLITFAAYWPALGAGFIWDDNAHVTRPDLRDLAGLGRIWFKLGATQQYYPVLHSAFWLEHRLWGDAAMPYHVLNVALHALVAILLVRLLRRLQVPGALAAGLLFALHPAMVESVAWVSEQKNTLSAAGYLLAALAYLRFDAKRSKARTMKDRHQRDIWGWYAAASTLFGLAVLSKTVTASLPAALIVIFWWKRGRVGWRDVAPLLPWFAFGGAAGLLTAWVERHYIGANGTGFGFGVAQRCFLAGRVVWSYLGHLVWPGRLMFFYPRWHWSWSAAWLVGLPAALVALSIAWAFRRLTRAPLAVLLLFGGTLFPALGFINVYPFLFSYVADHFQYLAAMAIFAAAAGGIVSLVRHRLGPSGAPSPAREGAHFGMGLALATVLVAFGRLTWVECGRYRTPMGFYRAILAENPAAWLADNNLGMLLQEKGEQARAFTLYETALRLHPDYPEALNNLGVVLLARGQTSEAMAHFQRALALDPEYADCRNNCGVALMREGRPADAAAQYRLAISDRPSFEAARENLARVLQQLGNRAYEAERYTQAAACYREELALVPDSPEAENNLGLSLAVMHRVAEAVSHYRAALRLKPNYGDARYNLGNALAKLGRYEEAVVQLRAALRLEPRNANAHNDLGACLFQEKRPIEAAAEFQAALRIRPEDADARRNLALALRAAKTGS